MSETTRKINPLRFVWLDAYEAGGEWYEPDYVPEPRLMTTYGYPVAITDQYVCVASTYDPDQGNFAVAINIPIGMLREVATLVDAPKQTSGNPQTLRQTILDCQQQED